MSAPERGSADYFFAGLVRCASEAKQQHDKKCGKTSCSRRVLIGSKNSRGSGASADLGGKANMLCNPEQTSVLRKNDARCNPVCGSRPKKRASFKLPAR